jgi:beta-barrel assembly-enhancing protease
MGPSRLGAEIASRASEFFLALTILLLLQGISAAQDKAAKREVVPGITAAAPVQGIVQPLKAYHDGSIRNIRAVGARDVGCAHGLGSRYSLQAQVEVGRSDAQQIEAASTLITDPAITSFVNRVGQNLVRNSDAQVPVTFNIIDAGPVNAFSLPGGFIFVNSGLILAADDEAQLAAVIAHEIAHVAACHGAQEMAAEELTNVASMPRIFRLTARNLAMNTVYLPPADRLEADADFLAIQYLYKAGYDPQALSAFLEKARDIQKPGRGTRDKAFHSDAQLADRIKKTQREISALLPPAAEYKVDTSEFQDMKLRLAGGHEPDPTHHADRIRRAFPSAPADPIANSAEADQHRR